MGIKSIIHYRDAIRCICHAWSYFDGLNVSGLLVSVLKQIWVSLIKISDSKVSN